MRWPSARSWVDVAVLLALAVIGLVGFQPSFGGYSFLLPALGGMFVGAAVAFLASAVRLTLVPTIVAALAAYFLFGTAFAVPGQGLLRVLPTLESLGSLALGAVHGWADIVTLRTPIGAPEYIQVVPYVATWLVAFVSTTLALRWLPNRRRAAWRTAVTLIGPVAIYLASILVGTDDPFQAGLRGVLFAVLTLLWAGWRWDASGVSSDVGARSTRARRARLTGTAIVVGGAVLLGSGAGFWLAPPQEQRFVLRDEIEPPFDPLEYPSPLSGFRHFTKQVTDDVQFTVEGLKPGDRIRVAALDSFTGKLWNVTGPEASADGSGSFSLVGRSVPAPSFVTPELREDVTFTIRDYSDVWVPSVGYVRDIRFTGGEAADAGDDLRYNDATGTVVLTKSVKAGDRYTIDATLQRVLPIDELADATVAGVELPPVVSSPDVVTEKAQEFGGESSTPAAQLESIRLALASGGYLSHGRASDSAPSRAGHGADRITDLLDREQMVGDEEQYASAFALMARSLGYPARVVMGFAPEIEENVPVDVTGNDVTAWVEVAFQDVGWVTFDPTPDETDIPQEQAPKPQSEPQPQVRQPPRADNDDEDLLSPVELEETDDEDEGPWFVLPGWLAGLLVGVGIPAAIILLPMLVVALLKARRMRRRRSATHGHDQVAGAWEELVDRHVELGYEAPRAATRRLVARHLETQHPESSALALTPLALAADEAVFSGREVSPERSEAVWTETLAAAEAARAGLSRLRRFISRYRFRAARQWVSRVISRRAGRRRHHQ